MYYCPVQGYDSQDTSMISYPCLWRNTVKSPDSITPNLDIFIFLSVVEVKLLITPEQSWSISY